MFNIRQVKLEINIGIEHAVSYQLQLTKKVRIYRIYSSNNAMQLQRPMLG
jgi:hypothetical protein